MAWQPAPRHLAQPLKGRRSSAECGLPGAIDHVKYEDGKWQYTTIGGEKPVGLCGSGLTDLVAELLRAGLLEENGILHSGQERSDTFMLSSHHKKLFLPNASRICQRMRKVRKRKVPTEKRKNGSGQSLGE